MAAGYVDMCHNWPQDKQSDWLPRTKAASPARWSGGETVGERSREKRSGARKVDLPVAQLLATRSLYYLLRLESPVSQGRIVEEAKYVTGDRQVSDRGSGEDLWCFQLTEKTLFKSDFLFLFYRLKNIKIRLWAVNGFGYVTFESLAQKLNFFFPGGKVDK